MILEQYELNKKRILIEPLKIVGLKSYIKESEEGIKALIVFVKTNRPPLSYTYKIFRDGILVDLFTKVHSVFNYYDIKPGRYHVEVIADDGLVSVASMVECKNVHNNTGSTRIIKYNEPTYKLKGDVLKIDVENVENAMYQYIVYRNDDRVHVKNWTASSTYEYVLKNSGRYFVKIYVKN